MTLCFIDAKMIKNMKNKNNNIKKIRGGIKKSEILLRNM